MHFIWQGIDGAFGLLVHGGNAEIRQLLGVTLEIALASTALALLLGLPLALALGLGRFPGRRGLLALANAGLGLPPVLIGLLVALLLFRQAPLGGLHLIYTVNGIIVAQTVLALPVVAALGAAALQAVPGGLIDQARALGAGRWQVGALALREARGGILAATIAALGSAFSEVGAVVLVGGNIDGQTATLASAVLTKTSAGQYSEAIAIGIIVLGVVLMLAAGLTLVQQREAAWTLRRPS